MLRKDHTVTVKGYARVSTGGETLEAQHEALRHRQEQRSYSVRSDGGGEADRAALARCRDTLLLTKLDRLARSTRDLLNPPDAIAKAGASFRSLGDP